MANDLVTLLANNPALVQTGLDEDTLAVSGGGGASRSKRISIKGGVFRLMAGGKEIGAIEDRHMNIIIVKMAHQASRMYYESGYQEGQKISPACWSTDSNTPDAEVKSPKAPKCSECEMSVKGSGQGGLGSACRLSWRTAVVLPNDPSGDVMQLVLPATSTFGKEDNGRFPFRPYVQHLASHNVSAGRVITKMSFDTKSPTPKVLFSPAGVVPESDLESIAKQSKSAAAEAAVKMNVYQLDEGEAEAEPQKRVVPKPTEAQEKDISDVVKKWSKK
jgi:hypothetical protein